MATTDRDILLDQVAAEAEVEFCEWRGIVDVQEIHPDVRSEMEEFVQDRLAEVEL